MGPLIVPLLSGIGSLITGLFGGHAAKKSAQHAAAGARLQDLMPQMQQLLALQQQHDAQNYAAQQARYQQTLPLQAAIARLAGNLLPYNATMGGQLPMPPTPTTPTVTPPDRPTRGKAQEY